MKTHFKVKGEDLRGKGMTEWNYQHQTACFRISENITTNGDKVDCKICQKSERMSDYHNANRGSSTASGCP
tara:strand:+ start:4187 stop:4399 length:213 start_codon:yes stop_codon:yes gene_type:complete